MKHCECANYLSLDCEKGMCALDKVIVPIDGEGSDACPRFKEGFFCRNCTHFANADKYGIGDCSGFEKENWTYALNGSFCCGKCCGIRSFFWICRFRITRSRFQANSFC